MSHAPIPRILFIDAYDSFTNNIISLLESDLAVEVTTIKIDKSIDDFAAFLEPFAAVIAGPGPGNPQNLDDVGLINKLWTLGENDLLPVLGICLGFQSLVLAFGGHIEPLPEPRHGIVRKIHHAGSSIFHGSGTIETVQYHSLHASLEHSHGQKSGQDGDCEPSSHFPSLRPLAWDTESDNLQSSKSTQPVSNPSSILMAVEHIHKPFYGIQFHPESICSNENARKVITTWWNLARKWKRTPGRTAKPSVLWPKPATMLNKIGSAIFEGNHIRKNFLDLVSKLRYGSNQDQTSAGRTIPYSPRISNAQREASSMDKNRGLPPLRVITKVLPLGSLKVPQLCESLWMNEEEAVVFDSETHQRSDVGTHSIIGIVAPSSSKLEYTSGSPWVCHLRDGTRTSTNLQAEGGTIFSYIKYLMREHRAEGGSNDVPFWGGLMGYITYEACLETIGISPDPQKPACSNRPDLSFVFIERSIVINFQLQKLYIQSIKPDDSHWISQTASLIANLHFSTNKFSLSPSIQTQISRPEETLYKSKIRSCQTSIHAGDAYELCLTTKSTIKTPSRIAAWPLYLRLRQLNPAPFSAYMRLGPLALTSSSPERFLSWSRPKTDTRTANDYRKSTVRHKTSTCQFRPIKGTVKRIPKDPSLPPVTLEQATALLSDPKERAENLMIVDLIRHDLHGVVGSRNVRVEKLMVVEEYATVFQLVTVIEGDLLVQDFNEKGEEMSNTNPVPPAIVESHHLIPTEFGQEDRNSKSTGKTGIDVLAASLPPGSMTGAPKRRACQILQELEEHGRRGVYSGVVGYFDVGGGGDFSVVIRSAFRWDSAKEAEEGNSENREGKEQNSSSHRKNGQGEELRETKPPPSQQQQKAEDEVGDTWTIGAGGAVTILSCEEGEWEEMCAKMASTIAVFESH